MAQTLIEFQPEIKANPAIQEAVKDDGQGTMGS
jgi:hypothetical protein